LRGGVLNKNAVARLKSNIFALTHSFGWLRHLKPSIAVISALWQRAQLGWVALLSQASPGNGARTADVSRFKQIPDSKV